MRLAYGHVIQLPIVTHAGPASYIVMATSQLEMAASDIEPTVIAVLMAEHPRLGCSSVIPTDVVELIAREVHQDVSDFSLSPFPNSRKPQLCQELAHARTAALLDDLERRVSALEGDRELYAGWYDRRYDDRYDDSTQ